ncbi:MAG: hypothetical protein FWF79_00635 [Defluviitaleaceae bacterium]|nr:hypothetical protein [Defluviitaleaceae bacterium]
MFHIIVNPIAGRGKTLQSLPLLTKLFDRNGVKYTTHITTCVADGYEKAKHLCKNASGIIGIGGDGTFQEIATGMVDAFSEENGGQRKIPVPLGIFPGGSGNDFIMTLAGSPGFEAANFFEIIKRGKTRTVDAITVNGMVYLNIGNVGLDARIVRNAAVLKQKYGRQAYLAAVYKSIARHKNLPLKIEVNGQVLDKPYTLVAVCNGQYYGGGMRIAPGAKLDDGKITLCLIEGMSRAKTMVLFPSLMFAKHVKLKPVKFVECENVAIILPSGEETLCLDGNLYPCRGRLEFKVLPGILDVFV